MSSIVEIIVADFQPVSRVAAQRLLDFQSGYSPAVF